MKYLSITSRVVIFVKKVAFGVECTEYAHKFGIFIGEEDEKWKVQEMYEKYVLSPQ